MFFYEFFNEINRLGTRLEAYDSQIILNGFLVFVTIKNGSYLRLKNAQIGYTLPQHITRMASIQRLRVYVAAENLLTFTSYKDGFDPEIGGGDGASATAMGVDKGIYPQSRTIYVGANVTF